jgi:hypothetical protein
LVPNSTKGIIFPSPISSQTSFRISIERAPDQKRLAKRGRSGSYLLVYKCATAAGAGPKEIAEVTEFRKAIQHYPRIRQDLKSLRASEPTSEAEITAIAVTQTSSQEWDSNISPYQGYERWMNLLTDSQKKFVTSPLNSPQRIEGPAGTGKTLCLVLKCIHLLKKAEQKRISHRSAFIAHSEATRRAIELFFDANDKDNFHNRDPYTSLQSLTITTLHRICGDLLHTRISETEFLDRDAMDSKELQQLYINESLEEAFEVDFGTHKRFLSNNFRNFLEQEDNWSIAEMLQHEISVVIKGRAEEELEKYRKLPIIKYGLPIENDSDRGFVFVIFQRYQEKLRTAAQFDTDDVVLSAVGQLNTPIWRRRRVTEGYDATFVDETHHFNMNELSVFHHLTKLEGPYPIAYSVDRAQALGDRGWGGGTIASALTPSDEHAEINEDRTVVRSVFRCSPDIVNLAFAVTSSGATLFTNFDDPMQMAASTFTEAEERKSEAPRYISCPNDDAMVEAAFARAELMVDQMEVTRGEIVIITFNKDLLNRLCEFMAIHNKPAEIVKRRGDLEVTARAKKAGRFVIGHVDYVGGLEFAGAVLVGVDDGRLPPSKEEDREESKNFLAYASHNRLYVAVTRAKYRVEILGVDSRGPSRLLHAAFHSGVLQNTD